MLENIPYLSYILGGFIGIGLAAATGFMVFLPLFIISLASYFGWFPIQDSFSWLSGLPTVIATGIATVVEIVSYYIPYVDHLLDTLSIPLATIAGTVLFASQFTTLDAFPLWSLALIAGGGTAATISTGFAGGKALSTATTGGLGNSVVTTTETAGAGVMSILAIAFPFIAALITIGILVLIFIFGKRIWKKKTAKL